VERCHGQAFNLGQQAGSDIRPTVTINPDRSRRLAFEPGRTGWLHFEDQRSHRLPTLG
jgi:hypothetical protein